MKVSDLPDDLQGRLKKKYVYDFEDEPVEKVVHLLLMTSAKVINETGDIGLAREYSQLGADIVKFVKSSKEN